ncbi:MAG: molybdopterin cofactor synthesis protein MoaA [Parcubacteria group bacterium GW2011_GWF2_38_76]|nr:MAG: molybdopterin cofactor synthesis protein MoaA [Parcubacteria group bacterium GW2011_GWF2_38_76]HBM45783.1 hypothetical protein [Patescibacteria group bacterium]
MEKGLFGLNCVNVELTNRCNKKCWMCGRRKVEKDFPELTLKYGDADFEILRKIAEQLPSNIVVQFHKDGEGLLYPRFGDALKLFTRQIKSITTNGKLLIKKADEIIDNLDTMSISIFEGDTEAEEQLKIIEEFVKIKGNRKPFTNLRLIGEIDPKGYEHLGLLMVKRVLHHPMGSFKYQKKNPTIPEIGICLDFLSHLCISITGDVSICVRFDPNHLGVIGNVNENTLAEIWNGKQRLEWLELHKQGKRAGIPLCAKCEFWGVPTST